MRLLPPTKRLVTTTPKPALFFSSFSFSFFYEGGWGGCEPFYTAPFGSLVSFSTGSPSETLAARQAYNPVAHFAPALQRGQHDSYAMARGRILSSAVRKRCNGVNEVKGRAVG